MNRTQPGQNAHFKRSESLYLVLITCLALLVSTPFAVAQAAIIFPTEPVGSTSLAQSVSITVPSGNANVSAHVLTQGSSGLDFASVGAVVCSGTTCSMSVAFAPKYPGLRIGAVLLFENGTTFIGSQNLSGFGTGSLGVMAPGVITTRAGDGCLSDGPCLTALNTPATQHALNLPLGEATDSAGNLYISDTGNNRIVIVDPSGDFSVIAGNTEVKGFSGDGGLAFSAQLNAPSTIAVDGAGNIFFADTDNNAIREIHMAANPGSPTISTIAGTLGTSGSSPNQLSGPQGFAFDASGNLYIADTGNNRVLKVDTSGTVTTISGSYNQPWSVAVSANDGSLYIADLGTNRIIKVTPSNSIEVVAGPGSTVIGPTLNAPSSVAVDPAENLYIADSENNVIEKVNQTQSPAVITPFAGNNASESEGDDEDANLASLNKPFSVYFDGIGNLFIADRLGLRIREVSGSAAVVEFRTSVKEGKLSTPAAQAVANDGNAQLNLTSLPNTTATPVTLYAALDTNPGDPVTTTCTTSVPLAIGGSCILAVEFAPPPTIADGSPPNTGILLNGLLSVGTDSNNSPIAVSFSGTALSVNPSSTTVSSSSPTIGVNLAVTFTALIANNNQGPVTGTVQFFNGTNAISSPQQVTAANSASITTSFNAVGTYSITATYSGDNQNATSTSTPTFPEKVEQATGLSVTSSGNPGVQFTPITLTATVAATGGTVTPTGSITFVDGSTPLGTSTVLNGSSRVATATFAVPPLAVGAHNITASYAGDGTSFSSQFSFTQTINPAPTSTALSSSATVVHFSTPITFTATVTGVPADTPTGNVVFKDGANVLATVPVNALGVATYTNTTLLAGLHAITAVYQGDSNYAASTSAQAISVAIQQTPTNTALATSATNAIATRPVVLTATVTTTGGSTIPTGNVNFMSGSILLGTASLNNKGMATVATASLAVGTDNVTAIYIGDPNDTGSTSTPLAITIVQAPTTTAVSSSQNPLQTLTPVVISATVANGGTQNATGLVTFTEDSATVGTGTLNANGVATVSLPSLTVGSHTFVASYAGDALNLPSVSAPFSEVVQLRPTTDVLTTSDSSLTGGQQLTLISVIRPTGGAGSVAPTGTVTFMDGSTTLATTAVDGTGVATVTVLLSGSSANLSSGYSGDGNYAASSSSSTTVPIGPAPDFSLQATPTTWQMQSKQHLAINVKLTSVRNFTDTFALGCSGLPQDATCNFSQDKTNLLSGGSQSVTLTVDTGDPLLGGTQAHNDGVPEKKIIFACLLPGSLAFGFLAFRLRRVRWAGGLLLIVVLAMTSMLSGCGSIQNSGTAPGTYNFLVTATGQTGVQQFVTMTMTITK
jgi:sugar lactone lactonase YvrE